MITSNHHYRFQTQLPGFSVRSSENSTMLRSNLLFVLGDYIAGALVGLLTAGAVHLLIAPTMDTVLAMILGMGLGMVVHLLVGLLFTPLLGAFHTMVPAV